MRTGCTAMVQCILQGKFKQKISIINLLSISSFLGNLVVGKLCKEGKVKLKHDLKDKQSIICGTCDSERKFGQWQVSSTWKRNFLFWDSVLPSGPNWPWTQDSVASASQVLRSQAFMTRQMISLMTLTSNTCPHSGRICSLNSSS